MPSDSKVADKLTTTTTVILASSLLSLSSSPFSISSF